MKDTNSISNLFLFLFGFLLMAGCNDSFEPLKENNLYNFNISGYLDASADTQWVRVGTIRHSIDESPDPTGIRVILEDLQSGETVVMNDSVFTSKNVLNYWTTMDIKHEQTYRIKAEGADGKASHITVTTPKELPPTFVTENLRDQIETRIYIDDDAEHIVDLQSVWYVILNPGTENRRRIYRFLLRNKLKHTSVFFGTYSSRSVFEEELAQIEQNIGNAKIAVAARQFFVASAGPEWDDSLSSIDDIEYFLDGTASNVVNGLGYVVGIDAKWFKQEACLTPDSSNYVPCEPVEPFW